MIKELTLLTAKPSLFVANVSEDEVADYSANEHVKRVEEYAKAEGAGIVVVPPVSNLKSQNYPTKNPLHSLKILVLKNPA